MKEYIVCENNVFLYKKMGYTRFIWTLWFGRVQHKVLVVNSYTLVKHLLNIYQTLTYISPIIRLGQSI